MHNRIKERLASAAEDSDEADSSSSDEVARQLVESHNDNSSAHQPLTRKVKERASSSSEEEDISRGDGLGTIANKRRTVVIENGNHTADLAVGLHLTNGQTHGAEGKRKRTEQGSSSERDVESDVDTARPPRKTAKTESKEEQPIAETEEDAEDELATSSEADEPSSRAGSPAKITEVPATGSTLPSSQSPSAATARQPRSRIPPPAIPGRVVASNATSISDPALAAAFGPRRAPSQPNSPARPPIQLQSPRSSHGQVPVLQGTSEQAAANQQMSTSSITHTGTTSAPVAIGPPRARPRQNAPPTRPAPPPSGSVIEIFDTDEEDEIATSATNAPEADRETPLDIVQSLPVQSEHVEVDAHVEAAEEIVTAQADEQAGGDISVETVEVGETARSDIYTIMTGTSTSPTNLTSTNNIDRRSPALDNSTTSPVDKAPAPTGRKPPLQPPGASLALSDSVPHLLAPVPTLTTVVAPERRSSTPIVLGYHERPPASPTSRNALIANGEASEVATERKAADSRVSEDSQTTAPDLATAVFPSASVDRQQEEQKQQNGMPKMTEVIGRGMNALGSAAMAVKQAVFPTSVQTAASLAPESSKPLEKPKATLVTAKKPTTAPVGLSASTAPSLLPKANAQLRPLLPARPSTAISPTQVGQASPRPRVRSPPVERWTEVYTALQKMINDQAHANSEAGYDRRAAHLETAAYLREEAEDRKVVQTFEAARHRRRKGRQDYWQRTFNQEATSATSSNTLGVATSSAPKPPTVQEPVEPPPPASMSRIGPSRKNASTPAHIDRESTTSQYAIHNLPKASMPPPTVATQSSQAVQTGSAQLKVPSYIPVPTKLSRPLQPANFWYPVRRGKDTTTPAPLFIGRATGDIERPASRTQSSIDRSATATPDLNLTAQNDGAHPQPRSDAPATALTSLDRGVHSQSQDTARAIAQPSTSGQAAHSDITKVVMESQTGRTRVSPTHPVMQHYDAITGRAQIPPAGAAQAETSRTQAAGQALTGAVEARLPASGTSGQQQHLVQPIPPHRGHAGNPTTRPASVVSGRPLPSLDGRSTAGIGLAGSGTPGQGTHPRHTSDGQTPSQPARPELRAALRTSTSSAAAPAGDGQNGTIDPMLLHRSTSGNRSIHVNPAHPVWNHTVPQQATSNALRSHSRSSSGGRLPPAATHAGLPQTSHSRQATQQTAGTTAQPSRLRQSISGQGAQSNVPARDAGSQHQTQLEQQRLRLLQQQQQQQQQYRQQQMQTGHAPSQTIGHQQVVAHQPLRSHLLPANWAAQTPESEAALQRAYTASKQLEEFARVTGQTADHAYIQSKIAELRSIGLGTADVAMFEMRCIYYMVVRRTRYWDPPELTKNIVNNRKSSVDGKKCRRSYRCSYRCRIRHNKLLHSLASQGRQRNICSNPLISLLRCNISTSILNSRSIYIHKALVSRGNSLCRNRLAALEHTICTLRLPRLQKRATRAYLANISRRMLAPAFRTSRRIKARLRLMLVVAQWLSSDIAASRRRICSRTSPRRSICSRRCTCSNSKRNKC